jgi:hypothetical protein
MVREFIVAEEGDEYGEIILSLAAIEVRAAADDVAAAQQQQPRHSVGVPIMVLLSAVAVELVCHSVYSLLSAVRVWAA